MATPCNEECLSCREDGAKEDVYICLRSEAEFLSSLLRKREGGLKNLLGFDPTDLVDWFIYAKRSFSASGTEDALGSGLRLLDELAKLLFGVGQVTARDERGRLLLLSEAEIPLVEAFIGGSPGGDSYEELVAAAQGSLANVESTSTLSPEHYLKKLEIRMGIVQLWRPAPEQKELLTFRWGLEGKHSDVWMLYWDSAKKPDRRDGLEISRRRLAKAYLHGVALFALGPVPRSDDAPQGYFIDPVDPEHDGSSMLVQKTAVHGQTVIPRQVFCQIPTPANSKLRLACEAASTFLEEYSQHGIRISDKPDEDPGLFDLLFMCKGEDGWFWAFSKAQYDYIAEEWSRRAYDKRGLRSALEVFRFNTAGFVNLLERTGNLIVELRDFREEKFICVGVGYKLEAADATAADFTKAEGCIPEIQESSFYYLRISNQRKDRALEDGIVGRGPLAEGSLVALFRIPSSLWDAPSQRLRLMGGIRSWVERWRAKDHSLPRIREVVQEIERPYQRRTARAAIMSRNLSHNIGSHALANSRFYDCVGVLHLETTAPSRNDEKTEEESRHPSPPFGRTTTRITKGEVWRARTRLGTLNSYLQGRMDFIARALGESPSHPEPIFFVNDLLKGFLAQTVLLNTLLSDNGFTCENMEFRVTLPGVSGPLVFQRPLTEDYELRHASFELAGQGAFQDVLVAVPGGMVGRHAFYAFLENLMRNAAKYGALARHAAQAKDGRFVVHLRLEERGTGQGLPSVGSEESRSACYELTVTDSLSLDMRVTPGGLPEMRDGLESEVGKIARQIRAHLTRDIIDETGQTHTEGHGIQEMKMCAQFLAGGDRRALVYPGDDRCSRTTETADAPYREYLIQRREFLEGAVSGRQGGSPAWIGYDVQNSLRCFDLFCDREGQVTAEAGTRESDTHPYLAYQLILLRPTLLGIVRLDGSPQKAPVEPAAREASVVFYDTIDTLAKNPAYFGVIVAAEPPSKALIEEICVRHTALPFRLVVAVETDKRRIEWERKIDQWQREMAEAWWRESAQSVSGHAFPLPPRRIYVILAPDLVSKAKRPETVEPKDWQSVVCRLYEQWLMAFKGHELAKAYPKGQRGPWHLCIGFDRDAKTIESKWFPDVQEPAAFKSDLVCLHLFDKNMNLVGLGSESGDFNIDFLQDPTRNDLRHAVLVLDNHGKVFSALAATSPLRSVAAYHRFSGAEQVALFQLLDNPPAEPTSRAFLVYSVVEALLTRIAVVDERVAEATAEKDSDGSWAILGSKAKQLQAARIYPLYSVQTERRIDERATALSHPLSVTIGEALANRRDSIDLSGTEGLAVAPQSKSRDAVGLKVAVVDDYGEACFAEPEEVVPDCIVIHEGVVDVVHSVLGWPEGLHRQLYSFCPWIVRTSGRGSMSRHLGDDLPFLEFSELSDATYRQMNKISLAKALLALRSGKA